MDSQNIQPQQPELINQKSCSIKLPLIIGSFILLFVLLIGIFCLGTQQNKPLISNNSINQSTPNPSVPLITISPTIASVENTPIGSPKNSVNEQSKVYLIKDWKDKNNKAIKDIYLLLPPGAKVTYQTPDLLNTKVSFNDNEYLISAEMGGRGGPCPMENLEKKCGYIDEKIDTPLNSIKINMFRIWHNENGIFYLNPWDITINGFYLNHLSITKNSPNKLFSQDEVDKWKAIIQSINNN
jgi:hypothetical protein